MEGHSWCKNLAVAVLAVWEEIVSYFESSLIPLLSKGRLIRKKNNKDIAQKLSHAIVRETRWWPERSTCLFCPVAEVVMS